MSEVTAKTARVLKRRDQRAEWDLPKATINGFMRAKCNGILCTSFGANLIVMPYGQKSPIHSFNGEHIIVLLEGELEFRHEEEVFALEPYDMLYIPVDYSYEYANVGTGNCLFVGIVGKVEEWPARSTYVDE